MEHAASPSQASDEALVAVEWVGLCGTDAEEYLHGPVVAQPCVVLGHEVVGRVHTAAPDGSGPPIGTRVVVDVVTGCGSCFYCNRHEDGLCPNLVVMGLDVDGGLATLVSARAARLIDVPSHLELRNAVLAEPLAVAVRALRKIGHLQGARLLVTGGGTVGMLTAQAASAAGAALVVVVEPDPWRRELLESWGATTIWASTSQERRELLGALFPGRGIDAALECSGRTGMAAEATSLVRPGGMVVLLGVNDEPEAIDVLDVVLHEKLVRGSAAHMYDDDVAVAVEMLAAGSVDVSPMITHEFDLDQVGLAFETLVDRAAGVLKIVVRVAGPNDPLFSS